MFVISMGKSENPRKKCRPKFLETNHMYVSHSKLAKADDPPTKELPKKRPFPHTLITVNPRRVLIFFEKSQFSFFIDFSIGKFFEKNVARKKSKFTFFIDFFIGNIFEKMLVENKFPEFSFFINFSIGFFFEKKC